MLDDVINTSDGVLSHIESNIQPQPLELTCMKKRRKRTSITSSQLQKLEHLFKEEPWPSRESKENLAEEIGMSPQFVNIWFQNKRARIKKESHDEETDPTASPQKSPRIKSHYLEKKIRTGGTSPRLTVTNKDDSATENKIISIDHQESQEVPSTVTLFQCLTDMMAVEEGILTSRDQPRFNDAVNDALYGIYLKDKTVFMYSSSNGLEFI